MSRDRKEPEGNWQRIPERSEFVEPERAEQELRLLLTATREIGEAEDFDSALRLLLTSVCESTGWEYAEAWAPLPDGTALRCSPAWCQRGSGLEEFRAATETLTFSRGVGVPGRVWASKRPEWVKDISIEPTEVCPRAGIALKAGLKAALGVPILAGGEVLAVVVFFAREARAEDERHAAVVSAVGAQLGSVLRRKQIEQELRRREALLQQVIDESTNVIWVKSVEGRYQFINRRYEQLFHVSRERVKDKTDHDLFPKEIADEFRANDLRVIEAGAPMQFEERAPQDDGIHVYIANKFPIRDGSGFVYAVCGIATDITERKREEELLERRVRERTAELAKANEALRTEIVERSRVEEELKARVRQQAAVAELGQCALGLEDLDVLLGQACALVTRTLAVEYCKVLELLPGGSAFLLRAGAGWKDAVVGKTTVSAGSRSQGGYALLSGKPVTVEDLSTETRFTGSPLLRDHGVVSGVSVIIRGTRRPFGVLGAHTRRRRTFDEDDVHFLEAVAGVLSEAIERKRAEEEVKRGADWLRSIIETTQDAVVSIDRGGRIVLFNPAAERIFGYTRAEVEGRKVNLLMAEPYASEHDEYIRRYERTGEARAIGRIRTVQARRKNGEIFPVEVSVAEIKTDREVRYSAFIRDISEKVRLQERLIEQGRLAAVGITASKLAHEIGNPLNGMYMQVQAVEQRLVDERLRSAETIHEIRSKMHRLRSEITRLHGLLDEFSSLSRRERYSFRPTELRSLVAQVIDVDTEDYEARQIKIRQLVPSELPPIHADPERLKQVFVNLLKNAAEAMPHGGEITVQASRAGDEVVLEIKDTGVGIAPGIDIFEPFVTTKPKGTGLGLMIVRQIVLAHQGTIAYTSDVGKGTTFRLTLPLSRSERDTRQNPPEL
ncbi:MAG TPA: PAS domain S-box protein [Candidatus Acidoferrales bacterium]|nr:PAS domain S-box protein [Candidatus Acidoferrales bacterium]